MASDLQSDSPTGSLSELHAAGGAAPSADALHVLPDDTIDLRAYIDVLVRWWKEILVISLLSGVIAGGAFWLLQATSETLYAASADAAIVRTVSEVTLDERFVTTADSPAATAVVARRNALIALAGNPALAETVIEQMGDELPDDLREASSLAKHINAEMGTAVGRSGDSDLIRITATTADPIISARVATLWTQAFVRTVNQVYGQVPDEIFASIATEQETSRVNYEAAQKALEDFLANGRVDELARILADEETVVNVLRRGRTDLFNGLVTSATESRTQVAEAIGDAQAQNLASPIVAEQQGKQQVLQAYVDALYQGQTAVILEQSERDRQLLQGYYARWLAVSRALGDAQALRDQTASLVSEETEAVASGSSALLLSLLKLRAFSAELDTPVTQEMAVDTPSDITVNAAAADAQAAAAPGLVQSSQPVQVQIGSTPLQIQLSDATALTNAQIVAELDALLETLAQRRDVLQAEIDALSSAILSGANMQLPAVTPNQNAVAESLPALVTEILGSSIITSTAAAQQGASVWDVGELSQLYNTTELQALALAQGGSNDVLRETIAAAEARLRSLKSELEAERTTQLELSEARDLAQDAFRAANSKKTELTLARAGAGGEVRFAAPAIAPAAPIAGVSPLLIAIAAAMAGFVLAVIYAYIADAMGQAPFLSQRRSGRKQTFAAA